jgi:hypothetical protein
MYVCMYVHESITLIFNRHAFNQPESNKLTKMILAVKIDGKLKNNVMFSKTNLSP